MHLLHPSLQNDLSLNTYYTDGPPIMAGYSQEIPNFCAKKLII